MSALEDAAAALARQQRIDAENRAARDAEARREKQEAMERFQAKGREFFAFACDHGARVFPCYTNVVRRRDGWGTRAHGPCVVAYDFKLSGAGHWAVTSNGLLYVEASIRRKRDFSHTWGMGIHESVFVSAREYGGPFDDSVAARFVAAAASILNPRPMYRNDPALHGIQENGSITYYG